MKIYVKVMLSILLLAHLRAYSAPKDLDNYVEGVASQGEVLPGTVMEGSVGWGGLQPDYVVDFTNKRFDLLRKRMRQIRDSKLSYVEKLEQVVKYVSRNVFEDRDHDSPAYRRLMKKFREAGKDIPLSEYIKLKAGVCREDALVLHEALREVGIPSKFYYVKVQFRWNEEGDYVKEDHAFVVVEHKGEKYVLDSNTPRYNGYKLSDLQNGIDKNSKVKALPFAQRWLQVERSVTEINSYPKMWVPKACAENYGKFTTH